MTNRKTTKRALLGSIVSLVLCFSMLLGTTYAWFTDSASTAVNTIQSGNLDLEVYYAFPSDVVDGDIPADAWKPMKSDESVFNQAALWEPGYTEIVFFKFDNAGSLAFQYQFQVDILKEIKGKTKDGADIQLSNYIQAYACVGAEWSYKGNLFTKREDVVNPQYAPEIFCDTLYNAANMGVNRADDPYTNALSLDHWQWLNPEETSYVTLALWMPTTVGNEANHDGTNKPSIDLGINVLATQYTYENDSFDDQYDKDATYDESISLFSGVDIHNSTTSSGIFKLSSNIKTSDYGDEARYGYGYEYIIRKGADYTLNLNGKTITHDTVNENANHNAFTYLFVANNPGTKLTIEGNGEVYSGNSEGYACALQGKDGTLMTVNGGEYQVDNGIAVWAGAGSHIVINGGSFVNGNAKTDHELIYSSGGVIDIYGGFFHNTDGNYTLNVEDRNRATGFINVYGGTYVNFDPSTGGQDPNNIKVADGYKVVSETQANGDVWYTVIPE